MSGTFKDYDQCQRFPTLSAQFLFAVKTPQDDEDRKLVGNLVAANGRGCRSSGGSVFPSAAIVRVIQVVRASLSLLACNNTSSGKKWHLLQ
jgi:hypothetical protein